MTHTLLLRLAGPMQAWGVSSRFSIRETLTEPSKSGVIGLLCAALGWDRVAETLVVAGQRRTLADLATLPFAVRVVREGVVRRDYHTAQNVLRAKAKLRPGKPVAEGDLQQTVLSERYYLSDAYFLAGLESSDAALLRALDAALERPHWPLSLGRKAFVPALPVRFATGEALGVVNLPLAEALLTTADPFWQPRRRYRTVGKPADEPAPPMPTSRFVTDAPDEPAPVVGDKRLTLTRRAQRTDVPLSFSPRRFAPREVSIFTVSDYVPLETDS